jgi:hypothetical protein
MVRVPEGLTEATLNRLQAVLADVPVNGRPNFRNIANQLRLTATEVTVGVWQLVNAGRIDKISLKPARSDRGRSYCAHPDACAAKTSGACSLGCRPPTKPSLSTTAPQPARQPPGLTPPVHQVATVWCDQCDRKVPLAKAVNCQSRFCKAQLPPSARECPL